MCSSVTSTCPKSGFDLTEKVRADRFLHDLPAVLVTALESLEDQARGGQVGADAYILKGSFSDDRLLATVRSLCERLPIAMTLACTQAGLPPAVALTAATVNAAHVLGRADRVGCIAAGYAADLVLVDAADWRHLVYHFGGDVVVAVVKDGAVVWAR